MSKIILLVVFGLLAAAFSAQPAAAASGTAWAWGSNDYGQLGDRTTTSKNTPVSVSNLSDVKTVAGGCSHSLALRGDGTVWGWGSNDYGQLGDGTTTDRNSPVRVINLSDVTAITGGGYHSLAFKGDGTVQAWGNNFSGQLGDGTNRSGVFSAKPVQVRNLSGVKAIAGGGWHSLAAKQ
jgi:alpha-tubulin suppressor-like RCC1 family protein